MKILHSLQALRGIAACLVVYAHAFDLARTLSARQPVQGRLGHLEDFGAVGVDVFFVISGVIITLTAQRIVDLPSAHRFALRRVLRVVPYYWLLSGLVVGLTLLSGLPDPHRIPATVLFIPFSERGFEMPYLAVGWTLCFEMLFYLCVYLARAWLFWTPRGRFSAALALFAGLFALVRPEHLTLFLLNPVILEFGFGIGLAWLYQRGTVGRTDAGYLLAFGLLGFALNLVFGFGHASELECTVALPGAAYRVLVFGVPSAGVVGGLLLMERAGMRIGTALEGLGNASYSIYLTHTITFELLRAAVARDSLAPDLLVALALVLGVAVGFVAYHALERPLLRALGSRTAPAVEGRPGLAATGTARP
ncbi:acyltransferase [Methylobacterium sp. Leaf88]|uniref:acyltransferase family protein n=1 Tax=Methylobacterium sp. Leaf88 TaxID=1736244 RepID=UPI0006F7254F|nr:acyltransferase [Methylobacterium sp. Leaf88]KQO70189.1 hypothetical protein ASF20_20830 [Methylobacterium sp. Leaf88]